MQAGLAAVPLAMLQLFEIGSAWQKSISSAQQAFHGASTLRDKRSWSCAELVRLQHQTAKQLFSDREWQRKLPAGDASIAEMLKMSRTVTLYCCAQFAACACRTTHGKRSDVRLIKFAVSHLDCTSSLTISKPASAPAEKQLSGRVSLSSVAMAPCTHFKDPLARLPRANASKLSTLSHATTSAIRSSPSVFCRGCTVANQVSAASYCGRGAHRDTMRLWQYPDVVGYKQGEPALGHVRMAWRECEKASERPGHEAIVSGAC